MAFVMDVTTENASFGDTDSEQAQEVARILRRIADKIDAGQFNGAAVDENGNRVGRYDLGRKE